MDDLAVPAVDQAGGASVAPTSVRPLRVGVLGHYGNDNLGDEAIIQAVIENLRRRVPGVDIVCFSVNPENSRARHGVSAYPISRFAAARRPGTAAPATAEVPRPAAAVSPGWKSTLKSIPGLRVLVSALRAAAELPGDLLAEARFVAQSRRALRGMDLLLISGSNQFLDNFGGVWAFPYAMLKWAWLGRWAGAKVAFVSIGAGPLTSRWSFLFVRLAMRGADHVSFRDEASRQLAVCSWAGQAATVSPDLAFSLHAVKPAVPRHSDSGFSIGLNPMPVHDRRYWHEADDDAYRAYVERLADICSGLERAGHAWFLYSTQPKDANVMIDVGEYLVQRGVLAAGAVAARMFNPVTVDELVDRLARTDILVATRFHGVVLSLMVGRPAIGICYHRKTGDVLDSVGLQGFHQPIDELDPVPVAQMLDRLTGRHAELQALVRQRVAAFRADLDRQYEGLLDLVPRARLLGRQRIADGMGDAVAASSSGS
jgi:polysaccharide pyruvyl transferase WcaK-like protein